MSRLSLIICILLSPTVFAQSSWSGEVGFSAGAVQPIESSLNPGNRFLATPESEGLLDLRAQWKLLGEQDKWVIRPRWTATATQVRWTDTQEQQQRLLGQLDFTDAYYERSFKNDWLFTAGLFVEGWGPAEFINPSNPFFHLKAQNKSFFFKEKGKVLTKALWNPSEKSTVALVIEPLSNREAEFREGEEFQSRTALRGEWQSEDASKILGVVAGREMAQVPFVGEYLQYRDDASGVSLYWEGRHSQRPTTFAALPRGPFYELTEKEESGWCTFAVTGLRWEGDYDFRLEWIRYDLGFSEEDWEKLLSSVTELSPYVLGNAQKFAKPGLEFWTRNAWSFSWRIPNAGPRGDWQWIHRVFFSVGDEAFGDLRSGLWQSNLDVPVGEAWTLLGELQIGFGEPETELRLRAERSLYAGARWAW